MTDFGRVHCILVATKAGEVVYERFYDRYSELDKAEIRAAFQRGADGVNLADDNRDFVGAFRWAACVWRVLMLLGARRAVWRLQRCSGALRWRAGTRCHHAVRVAFHSRI
jgi:hypothetical protein